MMDHVQALATISGGLMQDEFPEPQNERPSLSQLSIRARANLCPKCGIGAMDVYRTGPDKEAASEKVLRVFRIRKCTKCKHTIHTQETEY